MYKDFLAFLTAFAGDPTTLTIAGLIVINFFTGVMAALVTHVFAWKEVGRFYETRVLPYCLGYLLVFIIAYLGVAHLFGELVGQISAWAGAGAAIASLLAKIAANLAVFAPSPPPAPGP